MNRYSDLRKPWAPQPSAAAQAVARAAAKSSKPVDDLLQVARVNLARAVTRDSGAARAALEFAAKAEKLAMSGSTSAEVMLRVLGEVEKLRERVRKLP